MILIPEIDAIGQSTKVFRYLRKDQRWGWQIPNFYLMKLISQLCLLPIILHNLLINIHLDSLNSLDIILYIVPDRQQLLNLMLEGLSHLPQLQLQRSSMVQNSVIAHILLDFEDILQLLEILCGFSQ